jgi:ATP/maltotriose-dependent transcriptional regulator MalT
MMVIPDRGLRRELGSLALARPLLEREGELAALRAAVEAARNGDGQLVVIEGPAGIGKTRLLSETREELERSRRWGALRTIGRSLWALGLVEAREHLRKGVDLAHQCGASALATRGNEELAATGAHPRSVMLSGLESLTASERRVAQMAAEEASNKEIAQALFVTVTTVEVHLSRVYRKLDIESRRQLASALAAPAAQAGAAAR